ncbi:MAG TPA: hypothetical protein VLJ39_19980 [Tepidisphaeraceae bacterium]|nr:hypothetical protein [Tepidisphaeraceae bacterium]
MSMRSNLFRVLPIGVLVGAAGFAYTQTTRPAGDPDVQPAKVTEGVRSIVLPSMPAPEMPEGPGKNVYTANCIICHSQRYVTMQPAFPRKTWQAEVEKMKKVYGAPIQDAQMPQIVDYLMSVRGK